MDAADHRSLSAGPERQQGTIGEAGSDGRQGSTLAIIRLPLLAGFGLLVLLAGWTLDERARAHELGLREVRQAAHEVADTIEASIQAQVRRGHLARDRVHAIFDNVVETTDVAFIVLLVEGRPEIVSGPAPQHLDLEGTHGARLEGPLFVHWEDVRLQNSPLPLRHRYPDFDWLGDGERSASELDLDGRDQLLALGIDAEPYYRHVANATARLWMTALIGTLCIATLVLAWAQSIRNRLLAARLDSERVRTEHLGELGQAAAGLAHETKNPLGLIRGLAQQVASDPSVPSKARAKAESILEEVDTAVARLGDFMAYASTRTPRLEAVDAGALVRRVAELLKPEYAGAGVVLTVAGEELSVRADIDMLKQILVNLLLNSLHASSAGTVVTVRVERGSHGAIVRVVDQGSGIPQELRAHLFRPYVTGREGGHGLGLAIVGRLAEMHGWTVAIRSPLADGVGTEVALGGIALAAEGGAA